MKNRFSQVLMLASLPVVALFTMGLACKIPDIAPADVNPYYDTDGDGISNAVEINPTNSYLSLDTTISDDNYCIALGTPISGSLAWPYNIPDQGTGYYRYNTEADTDDWGTLELINMIEVAGRAWHAANWNAQLFGINDLSHGDLPNRTFGGYFDPHTSHQNGLDVDGRYVRSDGILGPLNIATHQDDYDNAATSFLFNRFRRNAQLDRIIVDTEYVQIQGTFLVHDYDGYHRNHYHARIVDPDGTENKTGAKTMRGDKHENQTNR